MDYDELRRLAGLKALSNILLYSNAKEKIQYILRKHNACIIDSKDEVIGENCSRKKIIWSEGIPPLKNTGWIPRKAEIQKSFSSNNTYCMLQKAWLKKVVIPCGKKHFVLDSGLKGRVVKPEWKFIKTKTMDKYIFTEHASLMFNATKKCLLYKYLNYYLIKCGEVLIGYNASMNNPEYIVKPSLSSLHITMPISNPLIEWIQPFALVKYYFMEDECLLSNYLSVIAPGSAISFSSLKPMRICMEYNGELRIDAKNEYYLQFSRNPSHNLLSNLRLLIDHDTLLSNEAPLFEVNDPSIFLYKIKYSLDNEWNLSLDIANPMQIGKYVRVRIPPPHYISLVEGEVLEKNTNSIYIYLPKYSHIELTLHLRKRHLRLG